MTVWHPILGAQDYAPGEWRLVEPRARPYAIVHALEIAGERGYRATSYAQPRELVGYFTNLRAACSAAHRKHIRAHGPGPSTVGYPSHLSPGLVES